MHYHGYRALRIERDGAVLCVEFNRPGARNAVDAVMHRELARVFHDIAEDESTDAVLLTGTGNAFCAGGDLKWLASLEGAAVDRLFVEARQIVVRLLEVEQPIVAAINGPAVGLGATLALFCDVRYATEEAVIADPHVCAGVAAGDGGAVIWPWLVGMGRAREYLLTGDPVAAREAERIGLVNRVVPAGELLPAALAMAQRLASGPRRAIRGTKAALNQLLRESVNVALDVSMLREKECFGSADQKEAMAAFVERRAPRFGAG